MTVGGVSFNDLLLCLCVRCVLVCIASVCCVSFDLLCVYLRCALCVCTCLSVCPCCVVYVITRELARTEQTDNA